MNSIKVCEYSRSRSFHDDLILQDQASGERSQDHWSSGLECSDITLSFLLAFRIPPAVCCMLTREYRYSKIVCVSKIPFDTQCY